MTSALLLSELLPKISDNNRAEVFFFAEKYAHLLMAHYFA